MRLTTSFARKAAFAYVYNLCARGNMSLRVKRILLQRLGDSSTQWWPSWWILSDSSDVAMTVVMVVIWLVRRSDDRRDRCYLIRPTLQWPSWWMLSNSSDIVMTFVIDVVRFVRHRNDRRDCVTILIGFPGGSVLMMQSSGLFSPTIWRSDWTVFVVWSSGFRRDLLSAYFYNWASDSHLGPSLWWWAILNPAE